MPAWLYGSCIFLGAFLLFLVQPLIGKAILPRFGSSAGTWLVILVFFQLALLGGYLYAHVLSRRLGKFSQVRLHILLLLLAIFTLPIQPRGDAASVGGGDPTLSILVLLTLTVGLPYLLLAATSPLLQRWYADGGIPYPYRMYAVSNAGSMLALLCYPLLIEPGLGIEHQSWLWSGLFLVFALLCGFISWRVASAPSLAENASPSDNTPSLAASRVVLWTMLALLPSALLVATTSRITQDLPAAPFLFIVPLAIYLLSFVITFDNPRWYHRGAFGPALAFSLVATFWLVPEQGSPPGLVLLTLASTLFCAAMCCHGELSRLRPDHRHLTNFYLAIATGGALGGVAAALLAPLLFNDTYEYELSLIFITALVAARYLLVDESHGSAEQNKSTPRRGLRIPVAGAALVLIIGGALLANMVKQANEEYLSIRRSFYGVLSIEEFIATTLVSRELKLNHGSTNHGSQFTHTSRINRTTTYYGPKSGLGRAISGHPQIARKDQSFSLGVVGLGVGTTAAYANAPAKLKQPGPLVADRVVFYEIDQKVLDIADNEFSYLQLARNREAEVEVLLGDARQVMARQLANGSKQQFDVLAIDAFSSDSLPTHLLTREALKIYLGHLKPDGILAFHVSNRYIDLIPVMKGLASDAGITLMYHNDKLGFNGHNSSVWALMTRNEEFIEKARGVLNGNDLEAMPSILWSDDYSALLPILKENAWSLEDDD